MCGCMVFMVFLMVYMIALKNLKFNINIILKNTRVFFLFFFIKHPKTFFYTCTVSYIKYDVYIIKIRRILIFHIPNNSHEMIIATPPKEYSKLSQMEKNSVYLILAAVHFYFTKNQCQTS